MTLPALAPWEFKWPGREAPELIDTLAMHYLMSPQAALSLALEAESRAFDFFSELMTASDNAALCDMAAMLAAEEEEHIAMIEEMLAQYETPSTEWEDDFDDLDDLDEPIAQG